jgi:hypothetical protein
MSLPEKLKQPVRDFHTALPIGNVHLRKHLRVGLRPTQESRSVRYTAGEPVGFESGVLAGEGKTHGELPVLGVAKSCTRAIITQPLHRVKCR